MKRFKKSFKRNSGYSKRKKSKRRMRLKKYGSSRGGIRL